MRVKHAELSPITEKTAVEWALGHCHPASADIAVGSETLGKAFTMRQKLLDILGEYCDQEDFDHADFERVVKSERDCPAARKAQGRFGECGPHTRVSKFAYTLYCGKLSLLPLSILCEGAQYHRSEELLKTQSCGTERDVSFGVVSEFAPF